MGKLIFAMMQSLDGYVAPDGAQASTLGPPDEALFRYFIDMESSLAGGLYGRRMYEIMRYWDDDRPEWTEVERAFAAAWRKHPKWVASRTMKSVGPNTVLVSDDIEAFVRNLKSEIDGDITVAGPELAGSLTRQGLIDEYHLYFRPVALGGGKPYFAGARPTLQLVSCGRVGEEAVRLVYESA